MFLLNLHNLLITTFKNTNILYKFCNEIKEVNYIGEPG
jgi:hypothetical protein